MKTFVLIVLTLCVVHVEMSRKTFTERDQRPKSKPDQEIHHGHRDTRVGRSTRRIIRKNLLHPNGGNTESKSSDRFHRSIIVNDYGSGIDESSTGNSAGVDLGFGSGLSSGIGSGSSFMIPFWLNDGIQTEESKVPDTPTRSFTQVDTDSITKKMSSNMNSLAKPKVEPDEPKLGILNVLTPAKRKVKRSIFDFFTGSGDTGSGSSSDEVNVIPLEVPENSGSHIIEEVVINSNEVRLEYAQNRGESVATTLGSGGVTCVGDDCNSGSGNIEIYDAHISAMEKPTHSVIQRISGELILYSGMHGVEHRP